MHPGLDDRPNDVDFEQCRRCGAWNVYVDPRGLGLCPKCSRDRVEYGVSRGYVPEGSVPSIPWYDEQRNNEAALRERVTEPEAFGLPELRERDE